MKRQGGMMANLIYIIPTPFVFFYTSSSFDVLILVFSASTTEINQSAF